MLARVSVQNFLSFDDSAEFSMNASKENQHVKRVAEGGGFPVRLLQAAAIWGANASGKSNFTKVLDYIQFLVVHGTRPDRPTGRVPFKLRTGAENEPSVFELDIIVVIDGEDRVFRYRFGVTSKEVTEESLSEIRPVTDRVYFTRRCKSIGGEHEFDLSWWDRRGVSNEDRTFVKVLAKGTRPNQLFLHEAMDRNLTLLAPIYRWFLEQLVVLTPDSQYSTLETIEADRKEVRNYVGMMLNRADTGIESVDAVSIPLESLPVPFSEIEKLVGNMQDAKSGILLRAPNGQRFSIFMKDGKPIASRIVTYRRDLAGKPVAFETSEESDGTLRLLDLCPLFHELNLPTSRKVYVIDELDRSMHAMLTIALLQTHLATRGPDTRTQLIFTTHDLLLMDQDIFRRDEMWFIERGPNGETQMECLSDYKDVRADKDVRKAYLEGRYSGVPHLRPFGGREPTQAILPL
jgi:AAA15 family ATPase/GTPase